MYFVQKGIGITRFLLTLTGLTAAGGYSLHRKRPKDDLYSFVLNRRPDPYHMGHLPSRATLLETLQAPNQIFDVVIIGAGASGSAAALDAVSRGLHTAAFEASDFCSGNTTRGSKLNTGAFQKFYDALSDLDFRRVRQLETIMLEQSYFRRMAPHLIQDLPVIIPLPATANLTQEKLKARFYNYWSAQVLPGKCHVVGEEEMLQLFPLLNEGEFCGGVVFTEGHFDDGRMALTMALTAISMGAVMLNHTRVIKLLKDAHGKVFGVRCRDELTGKEYNVHSRVVINAAGAEADRVRRELDGAVCSVFQGAFTGTHFSFNDLVVPLEDIKAALLLQQSPNGHQVSLHPWSGVLMLSAQVRRKVVPKDSSEGMGLTPAEMELLFDEVNSFLHIDLSPELASSVWSNVVPLAVCNTDGDIVHDFCVTVDRSNLVNVHGGQWGSFRLMAEKAIDRAIEMGRLLPEFAESGSHYITLLGGHTYNEDYIERVLVSSFGVHPKAAEYLAHKYGDLALQVLWYDKEFSRVHPSPPGQQLSQGKVQSLTDDVLAQACRRSEGKIVKPRSLCAGYPILECEVEYCAKHEYAFTCTDILVNRSRIVFVDSDRAKALCKRVSSELGRIHRWSATKIEEDAQQALEKLSQSFPHTWLEEWWQL